MSRQIPNHTVESIQKIVNANPSLKKLWKPRLKIFKSKNFSLDPFKLEAFSYGWWQFVVKKGKRIVFNDFAYSTTTRRHQHKAKRILEALGFNDICFVYTNMSLEDDLTDCMPLYEKVAELIVEANHGRKEFKANRLRVADVLFKNANILCPNGRAFLKECIEIAELVRQKRLERNREKARVRRQAKHVEIFNADAKSIVLN